MSGMRKRYSAEFKGKVALAAVKREKTLAELSSEYGVHAVQIQQWKSKLMSEIPKIFENPLRKGDRSAAEREAALQQKIGQLTMELDWLKKKCSEAR